MQYGQSSIVQLLSLVVPFTMLRGSDACQSFATISLTEIVGYVNQNTVPSWGGQKQKTTTMSVNLTQLLMENIPLTNSDLHSPVYFSDAEQSRPFYIVRQKTLPNVGNASSDWYQLTSSIPIDREVICDPKTYPERVSVAKTCCSASYSISTTTTITTQHERALTQPCCLFLGITVASKGTYFLRIHIDDVNDNAPFFPVSSKTISNSLQAPYNTYTIGLREETPERSWIPLPTAIDIDEGSNAAIRYTLVGLKEHDSWKQYFKLLNNVKEADLTLPNQFSAKISVNNDFQPIQIAAEDYDGPGLLLIQSVDRETTSLFELVLTAFDMGIDVQHSNCLRLQIMVSLTILSRE